MEDATARELTRQLRRLNRWVTIFGTLLLVMLAVLGILLFKVATFVHDTSQQLQDFKTQAGQSLNVRENICDGVASDSILKKTGVCQ